MREGCRDVAITVWPLERAVRASERPRPEEQPVISQVRGRLGFVKVGAWVVMVVCGGCWMMG